MQVWSDGSQFSFGQIEFISIRLDVKNPQRGGSPIGFRAKLVECSTQHESQRFKEAVTLYDVIIRPGPEQFNQYFFVARTGKHDDGERQTLTANPCQQRSATAIGKIEIGQDQIVAM